jgi:DinB superfamily
MDLIQSLIKTQNETVKYFNLSETELSKSYGVGKWTIKQILVHLADADSVLLGRIKRIIAEPKQVIWAFDQDLWCENLEYKNSPLEISQAIYLANRQAIIYLAKNYYDTLGAKEFVHSETGLRTLKDEFDKVSSHNQGHIEQIKLALAR